MLVWIGPPLMFLKLTNLPDVFFFSFLVLVCFATLRVVLTYAFCLFYVTWMQLVAITGVVLLLHTFIVVWIRFAEVIVISVVSIEL